MQCEEFEDRLNEVLDERRRPELDAEISLHVETCPGCQRMAAAYRMLVDGFCALSARETPDDMSSRVLAELNARPSPGRRAAVLASALAIAAGVLIMVVPLARDQRSVQAPTEKPAVAVERSPLVANAWQAISPVRSPVLDKDREGDRFTNLAKESGRGMATLVLYVPGIGGGGGIIDAEGNAVGGEPTWAAQMSMGLKPLTESMAETFNLLLRSMPPSESASRS
jgi:hypothetical protein